jgi:hypothetical protein
VLIGQSPDLILAGEAWKYLDNGTNQGTAWRSPSFSDASWSTGNAELGYGDDDEATEVSYGSSATNKYVTTYFRKTFQVTNASAFNALELGLIRDDGVVVYVNGTEVFRNNMPSGTIYYNTYAPGYIDGTNEKVWLITQLPNVLVNGTNLVAVEIHQNSPASSDISFNLKLKGVNTTSDPQFIAANSSWKYLDNGSNQGTTWRASSFSDGTWKTGNAELGYGDDDEATEVSYGPSSTAKYITTYFRKTFTASNASDFNGLELSLLRDDGGVVYINGAEVYRNNMPGGAIYYNTLASTYIDGTNEKTFVVANLANTLVNGTNVIAVEIHQNAATSSDISFNLKLKGIHLQQAKETSAITYGKEGLPYDVLVYPNPNTGKFTIELQGASEVTEALHLEIFNITGQRIYERDVLQSEGSMHETVELDQSLPGGVYIMNLVGKELVESRRIVIKR